MKTHKLLSSFSILLVLALLVSAPAWADSQVRIVRLSLVDGPVQLDRATGEGFERAIMNMPIAQGMQLWTRGDSRAEIEFEEGNTIRLAPGTKIEFSELVLRSDGSRRTVVRVDGGRAYVNYSRTSGEDFRIQMGNREIALDRSVHFRIDVMDQRAEVAVFGGDLILDSNLRVKKNNSAVLDLAGSGTFELAKGINAALEDRWDAYRSDYHDKYAKSAYHGSSFYGRSDLNYYGTWMNSPYGSCWRPYGFDASWDPYSSGAWAYYPGYGYTFVSLYPWGWQPYRSGAWNFVGTGFGYCWTPNRRYYGYGWAPVYGAPSGYIPIQPPQVGRTPGARNPGVLGMVPVGNVNTSGNWKPTDPINLDRGGRPQRGGTSAAVSSGVSGGGSGAASTVVGGTSDPSTRNSRGDRSLNVSGAENRHQSNRGDVPGNMRPDRGDRALRQEIQRQERQDRAIQREQRQDIQRDQRPDRSFDRGPSAPVHNSPPPSAPVQMAPPPAPAPAAPSAPAPSAPARGAVPK